MSTIISREQGSLPMALVAVTMMVWKERREEDGIPEMTPVSVLRVRPDGRDPVVMEKVTESPMTEGVRETGSSLGKM